MIKVIQLLVNNLPPPSSAACINIRFSLYLYQLSEGVSLRCINYIENDFPKWDLDQVAKERADSL